MSAIITTISPAFTLITGDTAMFHRVDGVTKLGHTAKLRVWSHIGIAGAMQGNAIALEAIGTALCVGDIPTGPGKALPFLAAGALAHLLSILRSQYDAIRNDPRFTHLSTIGDTSLFGDLRIVLAGMWGDEPAAIFVDTTNGDTPVRLSRGHAIMPEAPYSNDAITDSWIPAAEGDLAAAESLHIALGRSIRASGLPVGGLLTSARIDAGGICIRHLADLESPA
jgi:hypothetical protein